MIRNRELLSKLALLVAKYKTRSLIYLSYFEKLHTACVGVDKVRNPRYTEVNGTVAYCNCFGNITAAAYDLYIKAVILVVAFVECYIVAHELSLRQPLELNLEVRLLSCSAVICQIVGRTDIVKCKLSELVCGCIPITQAIVIYAHAVGN